MYKVMGGGDRRQLCLRGRGEVRSVCYVQGDGRE